MEVHSEPHSGFEFSLPAVRIKLKLAFRKLDRLMAAISYAEAGNLDAVKEMLEQNKAMANGRNDGKHMAHSADRNFMYVAKHI